MNGSLPTIPIPNLALAFVPVLAVVVILFRWSVDSRTAVYAVARMLIQLLLIGYALTYIFETEYSLIVVGVLSIMLFSASWIAMRPLQKKGRIPYFQILGSITIGSVTTLALITQAVLPLDPWYSPRYVIPLAGMIFANSMNTVSIAAERFHSELANQRPYLESRRTALRAALIPITNSMFAVGLVSLPGMMTGQILSGVSPLIAVRYQIMVMCMIYGSAGISIATYLAWMKPHSESPRDISTITQS